MLLENNLQRPAFYDVEHRRPIRIKTRNPQGLNGFNIGSFINRNIKSLGKDISIKNAIKVAPLVASASALIPKGTITRGIDFLQNSKAGQAVRFLENSKANGFLRNLSQTKLGSLATQFVKDKGFPVAKDMLQNVLTPAQQEKVNQAQEEVANSQPNEEQQKTADLLNKAIETASDGVPSEKDNTLLYAGLGFGVLGLGYLALK